MPVWVQKPLTISPLLSAPGTEAARFSFLMSIPAIAAAGLWEGMKLARQGRDAPWSAAGIVASLSAVTGVFAITFMMRWLRNPGFMPFVI